MAEEEAGFTFVDKRRVQTDAPAETPKARRAEAGSRRGI